MIAVNRDGMSWPEWFNAATAYVERWLITSYMYRQLREAWRACEDPSEHAIALKLVLAQKALLAEAGEAVRRLAWME